MEKKLGKGLSALISEDPTKTRERVANIRLTDIVPNPFQPRRIFGQEKMTELVESLKEKGVIQPILVRPAGAGYELIAGERRWRAAKELQLSEIPAIIKNDIDDANCLEISIIENIQREELNPLEEANAYKELADKFEHTLEKIGQMVGKDKTTISNSLRILTLPSEITKFIEDGSISAGHAKALLSLESEYRRKKIAKLIVKKGISVRETEQLVKRVIDPRKKSVLPKDPEISTIEETLQHKLGTKVQIIQGKKRGRIEIQYFSNEDLQRLLGLLLPNG
ncbi:MAG: ParB/RepB/Spo0J family partition protein [Candidatus Omnitrophica bacterium]|nr:ParB/RepB/Spo0J family partition protein [Candidatus Omnitrophota bacterium]